MQEFDTYLIFHILQVAEFWQAHEYIYNKKRADPAIADRKNRAREGLVAMTGIKIKLLTMIFDSIKTQAVDEEQPGGKGADRVADLIWQ